MTFQKSETSKDSYTICSSGRSELFPALFRGGKGRGEGDICIRHVIKETTKDE